MAKSAHSLILEEHLSISISDLIKLKLFDRSGYKHGEIRWKRSNALSEEITYGIQIIVSTQEYNEYVEFDYLINSKAINYRVPLIKLPSNLGKGSVWYFYCPCSDKRCKKLHLIKDKFVHKSAVDNIYYDQQLTPKKFRYANSIGKNHKKKIKLLMTMYEPYFKPTYCGEFTKRQRKIMGM